MPTAVERQTEELVGKTQPGHMPLRFSSSALDPLELWSNPDLANAAAEVGREPMSASARTLRSKWFWYSVMSLLCWTAWALTAKVGSSELPPAEMQFISGLGFLVVSIAVAACAKKDSHTNRKGKIYSVISGVLLGTGGLASFAAYRIGINTAATTGITSLYPAITVLGALVILKEKLTSSQLAGLCFSGLAILLFSF